MTTAPSTLMTIGIDPWGILGMTQPAAAWGQAIFDYLRRHQRWAWIAPWRWYMRRVWVPMKPSARRIVWLLILITMVEFLFFVFVALIWWLEHRS